MPPSTGFGTYDWFQQQTVVKQISCPSIESKTDGEDGLGFTFGTAMPELIGYLFAYNFSGLGNNQGDFFSKMGFESVDQSNRVLGYNYFLPLMSKGKPQLCSTDSLSGCNSGTDAAYLYIRSYPTAPAGNMFAIVDDLMDINPGSMLQAMFSEAMGEAPQCKQVTLPVGSSMNFCGNPNNVQLGYQTSLAAAQETNNACLEACTKNDSNNQSKLNNCQKNCARLWWTESKCVPVPASTIKVTYPTCNGNNTMSFDIPFGSTEKDLGANKQTSPDALQQKQNYTEPYANNTPSNVSDKHQSQRLVHIRLGRVVLLVALLVVVFVALLWLLLTR